MSQKKYQVFVSSTFRDLIDERQDAIRNILDLKHIPAGMELFPASDVDQLSYIKKVIDECDYYLLIVGGRYGSMDAAGISYTEREYAYAVDTGKIVIAFVHSDPASIPVGKSDVDPIAVVALNEFRSKVMSGRLVKSWKSRQELEPLVLKSLIHAFNDFPQVGWIRGDSAASDTLLEQSNNILQENATLKQKVAQLEALQLKPIFQNVAGLDEDFEVRCRSKWYSGSTLKYSSHSLKATWLEIFVAVAAFLEKAKTDSVIEEAVKELAKELKKGYTVYDIDYTDRITIKVQLEALGLISCRVSNTTNGGVAEFLSLTAGGRQKFLQERIVKKVASPE